MEPFYFGPSSFRIKYLTGDGTDAGPSAGAEPVSAVAGGVSAAEISLTFTMRSGSGL
jgi:hypothetical protein